MTPPGLFTRLFQRLGSPVPAVTAAVSPVKLVRKKARTVLIAWEMGGGSGHIQRLTPLASALAAQGHRLVFAFRDKPQGGSFAKAFPGALVVQAPRWQKDPNQTHPQQGMAATYPDMLLRLGYSSAEILTPLVRLWHNLYKQVDPALILCDHSPTAVLAAGGRIPVVHIGSGFAIPPVGLPFRVLHAPTASGAREREAQVLETIRGTQTALGGISVESVPQMLGLAENFACCLPELDPYRSVRPVPALGPVQSLPKPLPAVEGGEFLFGYLTGQDARVPAVLGSLAKAKIQAGIYVRHPTEECYAAIAGEGNTVTLYDAPQPLNEAMAKAVAVLHHGGVATTEAALAMGRPQFIFPRHLEQTLTADAVVELGCGLNLRREKLAPGDVIDRALKRSTLTRKASVVAERLGGRSVIDVSAMIVQRCDEYLA